MQIGQKLKTQWFLSAQSALSVWAPWLQQPADNAVVRMTQEPPCHQIAMNVRRDAPQTPAKLSPVFRPTNRRTPHHTEGCCDGAHPAKTGSSPAGQAAHARARRCGLPFVPPPCATRPTRRPPLGAQIAWRQRHRGFAPHLPPPNPRPADRNRAGQALQHHRGLAVANRHGRLFKVGQNQTACVF